MTRFVVLLALSFFALFFVGFNLGNTTSVSLVVVTLERVPVFFLAMVSFVLGFAAALPFFFTGRRSKPGRQPARTTSKSSSELTNSETSPSGE